MKYRQIPVSAVDRKKRGECRLCGQYGYLTKTHVPSKSAGNVGTAQPPTIDTDDTGRETYGLGKEKLGGIRAYWFCSECNNRTAAWDECFAAWGRELHVCLTGGARTGQRVAVRILQAASGQFARCLWAWMFAICDDLRSQLPDAADAVLSGEAAPPPTHPRLLVAATLEDQISISVAPNSAVVVAPPFVAFLLSERFLWSDNGLWRGLRLFDAGDWLKHSAQDRADVELDMPIVEMGPLPMLGEDVWS